MSGGFEGLGFRVAGKVGFQGFGLGLLGASGWQTSRVAALRGLRAVSHGQQLHLLLRKHGNQAGHPALRQACVPTAPCHWTSKISRGINTLQ